MSFGAAWRPLLPLVLTAALLLSACGERDDTGAAEPAPRLTKPQLVKKLGAVCQQHTDRQAIAVERFDKEHGIPYGVNREKATDAQLEEELVKVILPIVRDTIHDLEGLRPSRAQEADFEAFLRALEHGVAYSERHPDWIGGGGTEPFARARALSWKLGTALCGQA
jgi:hypothetical protein